MSSKTTESRPYKQLYVCIINNNLCKKNSRKQGHIFNPMLLRCYYIPMHYNANIAFLRYFETHMKYAISCGQVNVDKIKIVLNHHVDHQTLLYLM